MNLKWEHPFSAIIAGPSGSGKSFFVVQFIDNLEQMSNVTFKNIYWHYSEWLPQLKSQRNIILKEGLPNIEGLGTSNPNLIIIDDLMRESDGRVVDLFTRGCHHRNVSVFFITQNIFHQGKGQRDISLNAHYIVLFKNPRDKAQIRHLAQQVYPENTKFLQEAYKDATTQPHGYLLLDLKQSTSEELRFRTNIFPSANHSIVYIPKVKYK